MTIQLCFTLSSIDSATELLKEDLSSCMPSLVLSVGPGPEYEGIYSNKTVNIICLCYRALYGSELLVMSGGVMYLIRLLCDFTNNLLVRGLQT